MDRKTVLPRHPWAHTLEQRALHAAREEMHHPASSAGHYLYSLTIAPSFELPARRFNAAVQLEPTTTFRVVKDSQPTNSVHGMAVEPLTSSAKRMMYIAGCMAQARYAENHRTGSPQIIQYDFVTGVLLSGDESVNQLLFRQGLETMTVLRRLGLTLPATVRDVMAYG